MARNDWIIRAQERMTAAGHYSGPISGIMGPMTVRGVMRAINRPLGVPDAPIMDQLAPEIAAQLAGNPILATRERFSRFMAECAVESANFRRTVENLNYTTAENIRKTWPRRFPTTASAMPFVRNPRALANQVYNGRMGNAVGSDDGWNYRGRGIIQLTGLSNYREAGRILNRPYVDNPEIVAEAPDAVRTAIHFWNSRNLNDFVDRGQMNQVSSMINVGNPNGTAHGLVQRNNAYARVRGLWI